MQANTKKILVVEDDSTLRDILKDNLATTEGYEVLEAKNAQECLETALANHPELILLDILLPDENGLSVLKKIRADEAWGKSVKVIMLTNLSDKQSVAGSLELGAHSFLVKSDWKIQDVLDAIHNELRDWPSATQ